jgi:hypothetical protein
MTPEGRVKAWLDGELDKRKPSVWKFKPVQTGFGKPALDYILCVNGWFVTIETKAEGKKLTERQKATRRDINMAGGPVYVVSTKEEIQVVMNIIDERIKNI